MVVCKVDPKLVVERYLRGEKVKDMAREYGVSVQAIYYPLKKAGVTKTPEQLYTYDCKVDGCKGKHHAHGYCGSHLSQLRQKDPAHRAEVQRKLKATNYARLRVYEKTINGFLVRTYRNMKSRVLGVQYKKAHLYAGKELLPKEDFYAWARSDETFLKLYEAWKSADYNRALTPSIDRIDSDLGYTMGNMQWLTHSENSRKGNLSRYHRTPCR